jgi:class 3 adenylate cyclase
VERLFARAVGASVVAVGTGTSTLADGRAAAARYAWQETFELLSAADAEARLEPDDLNLLADAAWWAGKMRDCMAARERAFALYQEAGAAALAMRAAAALAEHYSDTNESTISGAWLQRAKKLAESDPTCLEAGYVMSTEAGILIKQGDVMHGAPLAAQALEVGSRFGDRDLMAFGLGGVGIAKIFTGDESGMALLDEATIAAVSGELGPMATGVTYCIMIAASSQLADYQRAGHWSEAARRWCERQSIAGFPGICRVHHAEVLRLRGALGDAQDEAQKATIELGNFNLGFAAEAFHELGEIRLRLGDGAGAAEAFRQANEMGVDPQPGLALLQMREGNTPGAISSIRRSIEQFMPGIPPRVKLLPAYVEILVAAGERVDARAAAAEMRESVKTLTSVAMRASSEHASALVSLADGEVEDARAGATRAIVLWRQIDVPYEVARSRALVGEAYAAEGDLQGARLELEAACATFDRLGALPDATATRDRLEALARPAARTQRKTFMFTDIVNSTNLLEAIGDAAWTALIDWHDRTLRALFEDHAGEEIKQTGDGFFVAFDDPATAIDCAAGIQRTLAEHRRTAGFAPQVRIGVHATEASRVEDDYRGRGVHESARIGAIASGDEILVSASTVAGCHITVPTIDAREVPLKGFAEPVAVVTVDWRAP